LIKCLPNTLSSKEKAPKIKHQIPKSEKTIWLCQIKIHI